MKLKEKFKQLFGSESENNSSDKDEQLKSVSTSEPIESISEKEGDNESDILVLNETCDLLNSPEKETNQPKPLKSNVENEFSDLDIDLEITSVISLTPVKEYELANTPGKTIHLISPENPHKQNSLSHTAIKDVAPSDIKITQAIKNKPKELTQLNAKTINLKNIDLKGIRRTHTKPSISYADNSVRKLAHSNCTITVASQSHVTSSHHLAHSNASLPSRTVSAQSNTHTLTLSNQNQPRSKPLAHAHAQYKSHSHQALTHSSLNTPYQYAYNETSYNSQPHYQHLNNQHSHAFTSTPAQSYYQQTYAPQAFRSHPY